MNTVSAFINEAFYTIQPSIQIIEFFYENEHSMQNIYRIIRDTYRQHNRLFESTIKQRVEP